MKVKNISAEINPSFLLMFDLASYCTDSYLS